MNARTPRLTLVAIVAAAAAAGGARANLSPVVQASPELVDALTGIDFPTQKVELDRQKAALDDMFGATAVDSLTAIADAESDVSPGVRIRAMRAIALYPSDAARAALVQELADHSAASTGVEVLELRAAMEALGVIGLPEDVDLVVPFLDKEDCRDVRAAAAHALRDIGSSTAIAPLRTRLAKEQSPQVQFAISDALRVLSGTPP